ncbi:MAG TPA: HAMP domain-containing sensor histidine kinase [Acidimicrobiales bacterium]|nr:HAMP domain-containing sensor histidine kinase [Acidimicrobiales bacterium]
MTLRLRLVLAVLAVVTLAQGIFFAVTFLEYRSSEYQRLDEQLANAWQPMDRYVDTKLNAGPPAFGGPGQQGTDDNQNQLPPQTWVQVRNSAGRMVQTFTPYQSVAGPKLPTVVAPASGPGTYFTSGGYRVYERSDPNLGGSLLVAIPTSEVSNALQRLVLIEGIGIAGLLLVVAGGAWLILRRGLHPLERMAGTASQISAGDLSQRVTPAGDGTEIGQLGLALNTMLGDIESAFAEREATEHRLRQFLADASHELRTPLTSIQGFAELFRVSGEEAVVDLPTILRRIEEEAGRMKGLVEDLLLLARLDERRAIERKPMDLVVLAADACTDAVATDPTRPVTLDAPQPVLVPGDEAHLRQAVSNLITNALRHTPAGSPLEIGCRAANGSAVITVRDHGPGLDDDSLAHVFDRFWQGDKARVGTGAGLGLSIVAGIAAEHGGQARVANAPDGGALFTLSLPTS